jgi:hypothetical protein
VGCMALPPCCAPFDAVTPSRRASAYALCAPAFAKPASAGKARLADRSRDDLPPPGEDEGACVTKYAILHLT